MLTDKNVLVAGATGYLGGYVAREFKSRGGIVRALARSPERLGDLREQVDEVVVGEVTNPATITGICDGMDIVFSSIGITRQKDGLTYMDVDYQGNVNLLKEAQRAAVSNFVYISVFNAGRMNHLKGVRAKLRFEEELKASGLDYTIVRPNGFFSDMLEFLRMAQKGKGYVFGSGEYRINPIHGRDLAKVCADAVENGYREIDVGGPDILTHNQILTMAFAAWAKPVKIYRVPIRVRDLILKGLRLLTPVRTYGPLEFFMTVLATDMAAPPAGEYRLKDFFEHQAHCQ